MSSPTHTSAPVWRIGEIAQRSGVSVANVRYYEREGLLDPAPRRDNQYRVYGEGELQRLRFIRLCRSFDMSLDEVRTLLALDLTRAEDCQRAQQAVQAHLQHVQARLAELRGLEAQLQHLEAHCAGEGPRCSLIEALHQQARQLPTEPQISGLGRGVGRHV
ncbi:MerR family transcriptional regulator [Curvibacter sp. HBC28]|uniref:MerR family transcriptional regulator n=1 Tax=Curvibacter microcysteis TaxID=3026419 RepID=A0ABT5ME83_9BURK|nr:MerR family transcriptional regulator [Curvibacter sp. HBC28]MDD0814690.1 MerR family transcriptional regulator [Curvibacter sp. HBC28]